MEGRKGGPDLRAAVIHWRNQRESSSSSSFPSLFWMSRQSELSIRERFQRVSLTSFFVEFGVGIACRSANNDRGSGILPFFSLSQRGKNRDDINVFFSRVLPGEKLYGRDFPVWCPMARWVSHINRFFVCHVKKKGEFMPLTSVLSAVMLRKHSRSSYNSHFFLHMQRMRLRRFSSGFAADINPPLAMQS